MDSSSQHPSRARLVAFVDGRLSETELSDVEQHVEQCDDCATTVEAVIEGGTFLKNVRLAHGGATSRGDQSDSVKARARELSDRGSSADPDSAASALHFRCPHCRNPVELVDESALGDILCPACGSSFSLVTDETAGYSQRQATSVGHFELLETLGTGAFGTVWRARDTELDRLVAVKIPRKGRLNTAETEQFIREARAAAQLKHPGIVGVHEVGREDDTIYIVSDLIEGLTLADWLTGQQMTSRDAAELCIKVAEALQHAHQQGVIHRDLKPSNIMLDADGEPHLMDFGLAKREAAEITMTVEGKVLGTPAYMSPEQARGEANTAGARSDVYSLGVILFELLTGERPFRGNVRMLLHQVLHDDAPSPHKLNSHVPWDMDTICLKCMEKEPANRYASAGDLAAELGRFLEGRTIYARPISRPARAWRWCRRNPVVATLGAASLLLLTTLAIGGPLMAWQQSQLRDRADENLADYRVEKERADDEAKKATAERDNVHEELKEHQNSLHRSVATVVNAEILKDPRFTPLKRKLLDDTAANYQRFLAMHRDDPQSALYVAHALFGLAHIRANALEAGNEDALAEYKKLLAMFERLARENPNIAQYQDDLATSYHHVGNLCSVTGRPDEALAAHQTAIEIRERLARDNPAVNKYQVGLVYNYHFIGHLFRDADKPGEALTAYQRALETSERLVRNNPTAAHFRRDVGKSHSYIGHLHNATGKPAEALASHRRALEIRERLAGEKRNYHRVDLAGSLVSIAKLNWTNDLEAALDSLGRAISLLGDIFQRVPTENSVRQLLSKAHAARAEIYDSTGAHDKAIADWEQAAKLAEGAEGLGFTIKASMSLARDGQYQDAITQVDQLATQIEQPSAIYDLARVYSVGATAVSKDTSLDEALRKTLADSYAKKSLALLKLAAEAGFFEEEKHRDQLTTDKDLAPLRDREDFQGLVKSLNESSVTNDP